MNETLITLRTQYIAQIRALIARHPAQAANESFYMHHAATAQLGTMRRDVATKGNFSTFIKGETVLVWPAAWAMASDAEVWHPRNDCCTVVGKYAVEVAS